MNGKLFILISLMALLNSVNGLNSKMAKKEVLDLDLEEYFKNQGYQSISYYCINDNNCQLYNSSSRYFEFVNDDGKIQKYIQYSCIKEESTKDCTTEKCTADSDCLSNTCFNNTCIFDGKSLFTECSDNINDFDYENSFHVMKCGRLESESCSKDDHCPGRCVFGRCRAHNRLAPVNPIPLDRVFGVFGVIIIVILGCCCLCCYCCIKKQDKKALKNQNNDKNKV